VAGLLDRSARLGLVYVDRHADLNVPGSTVDGALDWIGDHLSLKVRVRTEPEETAGRTSEGWSRARVAAQRLCDALPGARSPHRTRRAGGHSRARCPSSRSSRGALTSESAASQAQPPGGAKWIASCDGSTNRPWQGARSACGRDGTLALPGTQTPPPSRPDAWVRREAQVGSTRQPYEPACGGRLPRTSTATAEIAAAWKAANQPSSGSAEPPDTPLARQQSPPTPVTIIHPLAVTLARLLHDRG